MFVFLNAISELLQMNNLILLFSEFIVSFNGYYKSLARKRFIGAALRDSGVISWKILPRDNPAHEYPSDFDVVKVSTFLLLLWISSWNEKWNSLSLPSFKGSLSFLIL